MIEKHQLKQIMDNCLFEVYFLRAQQYNSFQLVFSDKKTKHYAGEYENNDSIKIVNNNFVNDELMICTALHELAHHVQYVSAGYLSHNSQFKEIHNSLLNAAFKKNYINPSILILSELYLANFQEKRRIIKVASDYIQNNKTKIYNLEYSQSKVTGAKVQFEYSELLGMYYRFMPARKSSIPNFVQYQK